MTRRYDVVVGTGGIGTGIFLALEGNHTLGREESRRAELLDQRDYCKLHIVCHYVRRLLGEAVPVLPVGSVGDDAAGAAVLAEMHAAGLDTTFVGLSSNPTLFSVCFLYPDGDGGNLSTSRSASCDVDADDVSRALPSSSGTAVAASPSPCPRCRSPRAPPCSSRPRNTGSCASPGSSPASWTRSAPRGC